MPDVQRPSSEPFDPEYRRRIEIGPDGEIHVYESHDGETWTELATEPPPEFEGSVPYKSETFFGSEGAMTVDYYDDGEVRIS
jgi:hypothetical protein